MKIGEPVAEVPTRSRHADVWEAASHLMDFEALPIEFDTHDEALKFRRASNTSGVRRGFRLTQRGNTVYVRRA